MQRSAGCNAPALFEARLGLGVSICRASRSSARRVLLSSTYTEEPVSTRFLLLDPKPPVVHTSRQRTAVARPHGWSGGAPAWPRPTNWW